MRSLALPIAAAALLALVAVAALQLVVPREPPTAAERAHTIAAELRCPDCQALSVAESRTAAAAAIRAEIAEQLAAGRSAAEIRQHFVARYGDWILLSPTDPLAWWLPALALLAGAALFGWWWIRGRRSSMTAPPRAITDADRRRVRDAAEALDD
ncbi:MAG TPA: cytochrome c-type biogenesis protein CcmH [Candidatus Limnocylindria bacterium]|jgi:cytochrome c-type biogenesis protein CcmH/NrfF